MTDLASVKEEMRRTAFQKKAMARMSADEVITFGISFFADRGYRAGKTGRPNQMFVMGSAEGALPRVTAEIRVQANVGKGKVTMVTIDGAGEKLGVALQEFATALRQRPEPAGVA